MRTVIASTLSLVLAGTLVAVPVPPELKDRKATVDDATILKMFKRHCFECHGFARRKSGLSLQTVEDAIRGGVLGQAVVPGDLQKSLMWDAIQSDNMPPKPRARLSEKEKETIRRWIETMPR